MIGLAPGQFPDKAWGNLCDCEITLHFALATACITDKTKQIEEVLKQIKKRSGEKAKSAPCKIQPALLGPARLSSSVRPTIASLVYCPPLARRPPPHCLGLFRGSEGAASSLARFRVVRPSVDDICGAANGPRRRRYCARQKCGLQVASWLLRRH